MLKNGISRSPFCRQFRLIVGICSSHFANGFKPKHLRTRLGEFDLRIPQVRKGCFYPQALERGTRVERAVKLALAEMGRVSELMMRTKKVGQAILLVMSYEEITCPRCSSRNIVNNGTSANQKQRYRCNACRRQFIINYTYRAC